MSAVLPVQPDPRLLTALDDTRILLDYASETGVTVDPAFIKIIVDTGDAVAKNQLTPAQDAAIWSAYASVSKLLAPVSASSLRATLDSYAGGPSLARHAVVRYKRFLVATLAALLVLQIYWLVGTSITGQIQANRKETAEVLAKQRELEQRRITNAVVAPAPAAKTAPTPAVDAVARAQYMEAGLLEVRLEKLTERDVTELKLLKGWTWVWEPIVPISKICSDTKRLDGKCEDVARYEASLLALDVLQRYFLALLYGLLGACAYILRTLTTEIRARIYGESSNISFGIRLILGMVGGMVIAWFVAPETADGLFRSLSPFALAFLAGYSVELLFAAMDRLISAFTEKK